MTDVVTLTLPPGRPWDATVGLVLGGLGARLALPYDRVDELQLAVASVLGGATAGEVVVEARAEDAELTVRLGPLAHDAADAASLRVLERLADAVEAERDGAGTWLRLTFRRVGVGPA